MRCEVMKQMEHDFMGRASEEANAKAMMHPDDKKKVRAIMEILTMGSPSVAQIKDMLKVVELAIEMRSTALSGTETECTSGTVRTVMEGPVKLDGEYLAKAVRGAIHDSAGTRGPT